MIINGSIRVQTKSRRAPKHPGVGPYQITLLRKAGPGIYRPYSAKEFDVLVVFLRRDEHVVGMFAISMAELAHRGYVANDIVVSSHRRCMSLCVYPPWSSPNRDNSVVAKAWQAKYFFQTSSALDSESLQRLRQLFENY